MVVTGASRGLGRGIAEHFTRAGYAVAGCSRGPFEGAEIENYKHYLVDVCDEHAVRVWSRQVKRDFGRIDVVVANVGMVKLGAVTGATSLEMFRSFVDGILVTTFLVCKEFSTLMAVQKQGRIITISSIMSELHAPGTCAYASAKKGVVEFTPRSSFLLTSPATASLPRSSKPTRQRRSVRHGSKTCSRCSPYAEP
jgi:3-oxoacyl-[acyl-carrier protein] reductase